MLSTSTKREHAGAMDCCRPVQPETGMKLIQLIHKLARFEQHIEFMMKSSGNDMLRSERIDCSLPTIPWFSSLACKLQ